MPTYLAHLQDEVVRAGARQVIRRLAGLDEVLDLGPDLVVGCPPPYADPTHDPRMQP
jgi:hypothetical protein